MIGNAIKCSKLAACLLIIINFVCMFCSAAVFAFSLWTVSSPGTLHAVIQGYTSDLLKALLPQRVLSIQLGVGTAVLATFVFFIAFMGFYGAVTRSQFLLLMYATLMLLLLLLECALIFYFSTSLIEKGLQEQDGQWTHVLRLALRCCEHNTTSAKPSLPWSCCGVSSYPDNCTTALTFPTSCHDSIASWLDRYQTAAYVSVTSLHFMLCSCAIVARSYHVTSK